MITVICCTNRVDSRTSKIARFYEEILQAKKQKTSLVDLADLPSDFSLSTLYEENKLHHEYYGPIQERFFKSQKFLFVTPEYNGSFPGILKMFIDGLKFPETFKGKKCALVGVSAGIQGGILAMSHLTDIFNHLQMHVFANKPKLSKIEEKMNGGRLSDPAYIKRLEQHAEAFIQF